MDALGINLGFFIAQVINFAIIFGALTYFGWGPLMRFLDSRSAEIAKGLEDSQVAAEARANAEAEAQKVLANARTEAQKIVAEARASAEERAKPIIQAAESDAEKIRVDARARAEEAQSNALAGVRSQVVSLAIAAANKLIGESMDKSQQEKIVKQFFTTSAVDVKGLGNNLIVTTALPLSADEQKDVEKNLGGTVAEWRVDPTILGGIVVRAGDKVVDGSVRANMAGLASSLN